MKARTHVPEALRSRANKKINKLGTDLTALNKQPTELEHEELFYKWITPPQS